MWNDTENLLESNIKTFAQPRLEERYRQNQLERKEKQSVWHPCPREEN